MTSFYDEINNKWLKSHPIPSDKTKHSEFSILSNKNHSKLINIVKHSNNTKINSLYSSFFKKSNINNILFILYKIDSVTSLNDFFSMFNSLIFLNC
jgi:predicted metalloendopeptidase